MPNGRNSMQFVSRPAMESIFLQMAKGAVEDAEAAEVDWRANSSLEAELQMQDRSMTVIVLLAQALEAFINVVAHARLSPALWQSVERMELKPKLLVVTRLVTGQEWNKGEQPFQDFSRLIRLRNDLVHYKPRFEAKPAMIAGSEFQSQFTGGLARRYFKCACDMVAGFFAKAGEEVPPSMQAGALTRGIIIGIPAAPEEGEEEQG